MPINFIEHIEQEEVDMLVRMPFRVGYWMSQADSTGGDEADENEEIALKTIVQSYAEDFCKSEFVQRIMELSVEKVERWPVWKNNIHMVPNECRQLIGKLEDELPPRDMNALKQNLYEIGLSVAMAYRELGEEELTPMQEFWIKLRERYYAFKEGRLPRSGPYLFNISGDEYLALRQLADVLSVPPKNMF